MYNARPFAWDGQNIEYVFAMTEPKSKQIIPNMSWMSGSGMTKANVPQTSLAVDSGAIIHFFSNQDLLQLIKVTKSIRIHCGRTIFD